VELHDNKRWSQPLDNAGIKMKLGDFAEWRFYGEGVVKYGHGSIIPGWG